MSTTLDPYLYVYQSIRGVPEYTNFKFKLNWVVVFSLFMLAYSIPCICIFARITFLYFKNRSTIKKTGLSMEIFQSFLLMQFWNILLVIGESSMFRIPYTGVLTSYCASENPQLLMKVIVFCYHFALYSSQLGTVLFCALRAAILYSAGKKRTEMIIKIFPWLIVLFSFSLSAPNFVSLGMCVQVYVPYPFGAILIISEFHYYNLERVVLGNVILYAVVTVSLVVLNNFVRRKIKERRRLNISQMNSKIERTLTTTMLILLIPLMANFFVAIGELLHVESFSYILLLRPLFLDARSHIVTCYFYMTHPIFKKKKTMITRISTVSHNTI